MLEKASNISYDRDKYNVDVTVDFGKDYYNKSDYAVINISINYKKFPTFLNLKQLITYKSIISKFLKFWVFD